LTFTFLCTRFGYSEITSETDLMSEQELNYMVPSEAFEQREVLICTRHCDAMILSCAG